MLGVSLLWNKCAEPACISVRAVSDTAVVQHVLSVVTNGKASVSGNKQSTLGCHLALISTRVCAAEHPFPAGVEDAFAAVQWVAQNAHALGIDPRRIAVAGDSAGGNLSTVAALSAKRAGGPPLAFQLLLYPAVGGDAASHPSLTEYAEGYFLTKGDMECAPSPPPVAGMRCLFACLCAYMCECNAVAEPCLALPHTTL